MDTQTWIYPFAKGLKGSDPINSECLGGKGAGLAEMSHLNLPVPPGFTIGTEACSWFFSHNETWPAGLESALQAEISALEERSGRQFGGERPLLVAVRSGAAQSMPGMMDTVLNLGLNDTTVESLSVETGDLRFALDCYRRFIQMFGDVVFGIHFTRFSKAAKGFLGERSLSDLDETELRGLIEVYKEVYTQVGRVFPEDPHEQLKASVNAVFRSYNSHRARYYRKTQGISDAAGTAVNVQEMVFGNMAGLSGTGVVFTRCPKTGEAALFGEWIPSAQGEDIVSGRRTPFSISGPSTEDAPSLNDWSTEIYDELVDVCAVLEAHFKDMQDVEFTVQNGQLFLLQTRTGKRSPQAAVQIAVDLVHQGLISKKQALMRVPAEQLERILRPVVSPDAKKTVVCKGLDASPGAACGRVVFTSRDCQAYYERDEATILVRDETSPEDIQGMTVAAGVLTARGGQTSHAAVVARGMGKPCVVGCTDVVVDYSRELFYAGDFVIRKGAWITIDGASGEVMEGKVEMLAPAADNGAMNELLGWADDVAHLKVRANADTEADAARARELGAVGIGLCRTEHMFFQPEALTAMRQMILADDAHSRQRALNRIFPIQREMFKALFREMAGYPVTIRLLDPPLHEFLPSRDEDLSEVAMALGVRPEALSTRLSQLSESNPMLGHRGVRIGVTSSAIYRTQVRAIFEAACALAVEGVEVFPEVMVPLVAMASELELTREWIVEMAETVIAEFGCTLEYRVGTMIELPRAALLADRIAAHADFFSFGTNDLTQMTYGFSRDDMGKFFPDYLREGLLTDSPLSVFDVDGVGQLVKMGAERGRLASPGLQLGVCGEHGGDPVGIRFFHSIGLDYVSCSPFRVPVARLACAHAAIEG